MTLYAYYVCVSFQTTTVPRVLFSPLRVVVRRETLHNTKGNKLTKRIRTLVPLPIVFSIGDNVFFPFFSPLLFFPRRDP